MYYLARLMYSRAWHTLVPDWDHTVMTAGYGTFNVIDYATTARTIDGATVIAYLPTNRTVAFDMSKVSGSQANCWWYDPSNGVATSIGTFPTSGTKAFTADGSHDWVIVIDDGSKGFPSPGTTK